MKRKVDFDWYCKTKKDVINNAAYELIVALTAKSAPPRKFELSIPQWDDLMIANIVENAINAIDERIGYYCHPFYHEVDKLPCNWAIVVITPIASSKAILIIGRRRLL